MKKWEDIVKDKLEEPGAALPEPVFAEFHDRLDASAAAPSRKPFPVLRALVPAVAAGLAALLFLRPPASPDGGIRIIQQPVQPVVALSDSTEAVVLVQDQLFPSQAASRRVSGRIHPAAQMPAITGSPGHREDTVAPNPSERIASTGATSTSTTDTKEEPSVDRPAAATGSPFIPETASGKPVNMKMAPAVGAVAGGGLLAAIVAPLLRAGTKTDAGPVSQGDPSHGGIFTEPESPKDEPTGSPEHCFPSKGGFSIGIPVSERWKVTTGLEYSLYRSDFTYSVSGKKKQAAHYLGIPVRLDRTLANNRWLDVYLGGGIAGDYCTGATLAGESIQRDGFNFSLIGAGGIQCNITKRIGLYLEPEISWTVPSENQVLETYRRDNPLMFSVVSGLRVNIGKCE